MTIKYNHRDFDNITDEEICHLMFWSYLDEDHTDQKSVWVDTNREQFIEMDQELDEVIAAKSHQPFSVRLALSGC